jgi:hypothetical protein
LLWRLSFLLRIFILPPRPGGSFKPQKPDWVRYFPWKPITAHTVPSLITHPSVPDILLGVLDPWKWDR